MTTKRSNYSSKKIWLTIGACILIILLLVWLTIADFFGDTDVAALITPLRLM
ncbi:MAG: hypothetical protein HDS08_04360 [Bacteroides sp.]|nr:hypothetical protein [Bacteroidales bacterium]MBD5243524.1 hypothetical protein [Barnesiella sp.]MBD5315377.1 hypothetical protein [Bacteroides sp.]MDE7449838.1 hypothetical protein [Paramuribaculum sp.]